MQVFWWLACERLVLESQTRWFLESWDILCTQAEKISHLEALVSSKKLQHIAVFISAAKQVAIPSFELLQATEHALDLISHKHCVSWHWYSDSLSVQPPNIKSVCVTRIGVLMTEFGCQPPTGEINVEVGIWKFLGISGFSEKLLFLALSWRIISH